MFSENKIIETAIAQKTNKLLIYMLLSFVLGTILTMYVAIHFKNPVLIFCGFIIFWAGPFVFLKKLRKPYTKNVCIRLKEDAIVMDIYNNMTEALESHNEYKLDTIQYYQSYNSAQGDTARLWMELKDGTMVNYTFVNQRAGNYVTDKITDLILGYNDNHGSDDDKKIILRPNFYATKIGNYAVVILAVGWICLLLFQIKNNPKTIPYTSMGGITFFITIWAQRQRDRNQYNRKNK